MSSYSTLNAVYIPSLILQDLKLISPGQLHIKESTVDIHTYGEIAVACVGQQMP